LEDQLKLTLPKPDQMTERILLEVEVEVEEDDVLSAPALEIDQNGNDKTDLKEIKRTQKAEKSKTIEKSDPNLI